jgi:ParB-like chromosome segregation protein Spo0J
MLHGAQFPPVVVFGEAAGEFWLADGYHRWHTATIAGLQVIAAEAIERDGPAPETQLG